MFSFCVRYSVSSGLISILLSFLSLCLPGHTGQFIRVVFCTSLLFVLAHICFQTVLYTYPPLNIAIGDNCSQWDTISRIIGLSRYVTSETPVIHASDASDIVWYATNFICSHISCNMTEEAGADSFDLPPQAEDVQNILLYIILDVSVASRCRYLETGISLTSLNLHICMCVCVCPVGYPWMIHGVCYAFSVLTWACVWSPWQQSSSAADWSGTEKWWLPPTLHRWVMCMSARLWHRMDPGVTVLSGWKLNVLGSDFTEDQVSKPKVLWSRFTLTSASLRGQ